MIEHPWRPILVVAVFLLILTLFLPSPYQRVSLGFIAIFVAASHGLRPSFAFFVAALAVLAVSGTVHGCAFSEAGVGVVIITYGLCALGLGYLIDQYRDAGRVIERQREDARAQQEELSITLDSIADGVIVTDAEGRIIRINPVAERVTGWTRAQAVGRPVSKVFRIIDEHTRGPVKNPLLEALESGRAETLTGHTLLVRRDGTEVPVDDSAAPSFNGRGERVGAVLVFRDISSQRFRDRQKEQLLDDLAERNKELDLLQAITELTRDLTLSVDDLLTRVMWEIKRAMADPSAAGVRIRYGDRCIESPGFNQDGRTLRTSFESIYGDVGSFEVSYPNGRGGIRSPFLPEEERTLAAAAEVIRTHLQDRRARLDLRERERWLRTTLQAMADAVIATDATGRIALLNERAEQITGWTAEEARGVFAHDILRMESEDASSMKEDPLSEALETGRASIAVDRRFLRDHRGGRVAVEYSVAPIPGPGDGVAGAIIILRNVEKRYRMERRIVESERKFRNFVERAYDLILALDDEGTFTYVSPNWRVWLGHDSGDVIGAPLEAFVHPRDVDEVRGRFAAVAKSGQDGTRVELRLRTLDGQWRWYAANISVVSEQEGQGFLVIARDVTERRRVEDALRESEGRFRQLADNIEEAFWLRTRDDFLYINPAFERIWDIPLDDVMANPDLVLEAIHPDDRDRVAALIECPDYVAGGTAEVEFRLLRPDGAIRWIWLRYSPVWSEAGAVYRIASVAADITGMRAAREALRHRERELSTLLEHLPDAVTRIDRRFRRLYANPAVKDLFEISPERYADGTNKELGMEGTVSEKWRAHVSRVLETGQPSTFDWHMRASDGIKYFNTRVIPEYSSDGQISTLLGITRETTEHVLAQRRLMHLSMHDQVTGLYNRAFFDAEMKRLDVPRQLPLSFVIADLNGLKMVNDAFGHFQGDALLKRVAVLLRRHFRQEDVIARWGGDEFAVLLPRTSAEEVEDICERLRHALEGEETSGHAVHLSLSLGCATKAESSEDASAVLRKAEERMYRNKLLQSASARSALLSSLEGSLRETHLETEEHALRLGRLAARLGRSMGLSADQIHQLQLLARLHDIGKISISASILLKEGSLTEQEWSEVKRHPEIGYRIIQSVPDLASIAEPILSHHEWWDGSGYPRGLRGQEIPLEARILAVADAYDVMTSGRPYRAAISSCEALEEIERLSGVQFDPAVVRIFVDEIGEGRVRSSSHSSSP